MYRAREFFTDSQDNDHRYYPGDVYPRAGLEVSNVRIAELATSKNMRGVPVIEQEKAVVIPAVKADIPKAPKKRGRKRAD